MTSHNTLPSVMLQAGIFQEEMVNFRTGSSCIAIIALWLSRPEVLSVRYGHQHNAGFQNRRDIAGLLSIFSYLLLSAAIVCLRPVCGCVPTWRVGMLLCHTTRSWCVAYTVPLFLAQLCSAQWPVEGAVTFLSLKPSAWPLVWSIRTMNSSEQKICW